MLIIKWILIALAILVLLVAAWLAYMGMFSPVKVVRQPMGPYTLAYESFTGPYSDTGPVFDRVYKALKAEGIETTIGIGIYYDDPSKVPADKLRSDCGSVVESANLGKLEALKSKFKVLVINKKESLVATLPVRNAMSYMIGPMKAYPALAKAAKTHKFSITRTYEVYDMPGKVITYVME